MAIMVANDSPSGKFAGLSVNLSGVGRVSLTHALFKNSETSIYATTHAGLVLKTFDMDCGKPAELSYGPYLSYGVEVENFQDIQRIEELRSHVPAYYGSSIDTERKLGCIGMEYLEGQNLLAWCQMAAASSFPSAWAEQFRATLYETLAIVRLFHKHDIILIDFKPDNVIRLFSGAVKFVDLGAFFTPRHNRETEKYVYAATPDYAELVIDTANVQTGLPLKQGSDIFSAGIAIFEMATGGSRLTMSDECAESLLRQPGNYLFRDSQIKDIWRSYPHLADLLPLVHTQLQERRILFAELWHLLKSYLASQVAEWESLTEEQHGQMLLDTGIAFIADQLPGQLQWLAEPIARATTLRSFRLKTVADLMAMIGQPIPEAIQEDITHHNEAVQMALDLDPPVTFRQPLNVWDVRLNPQSSHWAVSTSLAASELWQVAEFTFVKELSRDEEGHRFFEIVGDLEADFFEGQKLTLRQLATDHTAWLGS